MVDESEGVSDSHIAGADENDFVSYMICHDPIVQLWGDFCTG